MPSYEIGYRRTNRATHVHDFANRSEASTVQTTTIPFSYNQRSFSCNTTRKEAVVGASRSLRRTLISKLGILRMSTSAYSQALAARSSLCLELRRSRPFHPACCTLLSGCLHLHWCHTCIDTTVRDTQDTQDTLALPKRIATGEVAQCQ